ncbi:MAG: ABC transporter permease [Anaerolineae bacterium]|nr:ABC transporter permease [Gemmatimonadaceae bacterium]
MPALLVEQRLSHPMRFTDVLRTAFGQIVANKLRSAFTLLGIIVSVAFLVAVVAVIQGMNAYVKENVADAMIGANAFQVRRIPIRFGLFDDDEWRKVQRRPRITLADAAAVSEAIPNAQAVALTSGWPTPMSDVVWNNRTVGDVLVFGVTAPYQVVQDYRFSHGRPLTDVDVRERRPVAVLGADVAEKLFGGSEAIGRHIRIRGDRFTVAGVIEKKGRVLGQSFDGFVLLPLTTFETIYGRRKSTTISVKMPEAIDVAPGMTRAEEAMRLAHTLRPTEENDFSIETADALIDFWKNLTRILFSVVPAIVAIGIVVGGIVIMNIMLMAVTERTREIGIRKSLGATAHDIQRQFLAEAVALSFLGGVLGVMTGIAFSALVSVASPLPARVTVWSVGVALALGAGVGVLFGVYPASRAARLDPIAAMRAE